MIDSSYDKLPPHHAFAQGQACPFSHVGNAFSAQRNRGRDWGRHVGGRASAVNALHKACSQCLLGQGHFGLYDLICHFSSYEVVSCSFSVISTFFF